jgi:hypothetical protein
MTEFVAAFGTSPWGPMALAFVFGVAFGWVTWGAKPDRMRGPESAAGDGDEPKELIVIKAELQAARTLLDHADDHDQEITEQLSSLDETVKRANGRLKTILAAVKRAAGR